MNVLQALKAKSPWFYLWLTLLSIGNSLVYTFLLMLITKSITRTEIGLFQGYEWVVYIIVLAFSLAITSFFRKYMVRLTNGLLFEFDLKVTDKLRKVSVPVFEKLGRERIYTAFSDTRVLGQIPHFLLEAVNAAIIVLCCLGYLFFTSFAAGMTILSLMASLLIFYLVRNKKISKDLEKLREYQTIYHKYLTDLLDGFKEMKMGVKRNNNFFNYYVKPNREEAENIAVTTSIKYMQNELTGSYSWYIIIGAAIFLFPAYFNLPLEQIAPIIVTVMYMMVPTSTLIGIVPFHTNVKIALNRIQELEAELSRYADEFEQLPVKHEFGADKFQRIIFDNVIFEHVDKKNKFILGPLNLTIGRGELIFITGGNGSGKSTFINLLTGLYPPTQGAIYFNGDKVDATNRIYYSDFISSIFTKSHLFNENYSAFDLTSDNYDLLQYIEMLRMEGKISLSKESKAMTTNLSMGQQKRLSMIYSLLESREIMVLDEWAAEQDPTFKAYFYKRILPQLLRNGKTIIAVTHDDRYFNYAHRIIKFERGKIETDSILEKVSVPA